MHGYIGDDHNPSESMKWDMHFYISKQDAAHLLLLLVVMGDPLGLDGYYVHVESMISGQRCLVWWTKDGIDTSQQSQHAILGVDYFGCVWKWQDISPKLWQCTDMEKIAFFFFFNGYHVEDDEPVFRDAGYQLDFGGSYFLDKSIYSTLW